MATSKLQEYTTRKVFETIPHLEIKENYRPYWLNGNGTGRLELDIYIPELKIAIEVQGAQHYIYIPYFHNDYNGFLEQQRRDNIKRDICSIENIELIEVSNYSEAREAIRIIKNIIEVDNEIDFNIANRRNIYFRNQDRMLKLSYKQRIANLKIEIKRLEKIIKKSSGTCPKELTNYLDKRINFLTYILTELHGNDEMIVYRKWLRQVRGDMRKERNNIIQEYEGINRQRTKLGECKIKLKQANDNLENVIDEILEKWLKFYNDVIEQGK